MAKASNIIAPISLVDELIKMTEYNSVRQMIPSTVMISEENIVVPMARQLSGLLIIPLFLQKNMEFKPYYPTYYTDDDRTLFLVTLPCHPDIKVTKSDSKVTKSVSKSDPKVSKSVSKWTSREVDDILINGIDIQIITEILNHDISDIRDYVRTKIVSKSVTKSDSKVTKSDQKATKSVTKSVTKLIDIVDFLSTERSRQEILEHIGITNQSKNYKEYLLPFIEGGIIEMTIPDKPNSQYQKYRLTEKGKQLIKI